MANGYNAVGASEKFAFSSAEKKRITGGKVIAMFAGRPRSTATALAIPLSAACLLSLLASGQTLAAGASKGFVLTNFSYATYDGGPGDCPDGLNLSAKEVYLQSLPAAEHERLDRGENARELMKILYAPGGNLGPGKRTHNACADPTDFQAPPLRTIQGTVADGMDLDGVDSTKDGAAAPNTCAHQDFVSPTGQHGIDNQLWRAMGCVRGWRKGADIEKYSFGNIRSGEYTVLLEIIGMDDQRRDGDVQVGIYSSSDSVSVDPAGNVLPDSSLQVADDPRYRAVAHGRIVNGVLTTDPVDVHLKFASQGYVNTEYFMRDARLRVELLPDGGLKGKLGGYLDVETFYDGFIRQAQVITSVLLGYTCPGVYAAVTAFADGHPDPKTGRCTAISTAFNVEAIPAFVIHPSADAKTKTAAAN